MKPILLIIDDDKQFADEFQYLLEKDFECVHAYNSNESINIIKSHSVDVILLDLMLGKENGIDILKEIKKIEEDIPVIMITEYASIPTAIEAMKLGAEDYISKTPDLNELKIIIEKSIKQKSYRLKTKVLTDEIKKPYNKIVGVSKAIENLKEKINLIAANDSTVLITGESGTGKELVARQIHELSDRKNELFVAVNCGAIPVNLIESELFGHEQGAFTGAIKKSIGKFEAASGGTIFLDEISELEPDAQVKLMRVLQEKEFNRLGGNKTIKTNARVIAATNKNLFQLVNTGKFREDLYYRLDVFPIELPPLRERKEDIPELIRHFSKSISLELNKKPPTFNDESVALFIKYEWPGNIRELINYITRAIILCRGEKITPEFLSQPLLKVQNEVELKEEISLKWEEMDIQRKHAAESASRKIEAAYVKKLMEHFNGNITKAAEYSGINRTNLHKLIKRCGY
ncbi:MAG: sigma-54 dependent transcriptional regulator [bacterium]